MIVASVAVFVAWVLIAIRCWSRISSRSLIVTPFLVFCLLEAVNTWTPALLALNEGQAKPMILIAFAFITFLTGFMVQAPSPTGKLRFENSRLRIDIPPVVCFRTMLVVVVVQLGLLAFLYQGSPPLVQGLLSFRESGFASGLNVLATQREAFMKSYYFGGEYRGQGLITDVTRVMWPYMTIMALVQYRARKALGWLAAAIVLGLLSTLTAAASGERYPVILTNMYIVVAISLLGHWRAKAALKAGLAFLALCVMVTPFSGQNIGLVKSEHTSSDLLTATITRLSVGNGVHDVEMISAIDSGTLPMGYGRYHWEKALTAIPGVKVYVPLARQLQVVRHGANSGTAWASMTNLGVLYADFGSLGVIVGFFCLGIGLARLEVWLFSGPKVLSRIPMMALVTMGCSDLVMGSTVTFSVGMLVITVVHGAISLFCKIQIARAPTPLRRPLQSGFLSPLNPRAPSSSRPY